MENSTTVSHDENYDRIAQAISFIARNVYNQPSLEEVAKHLNLSPYHLHRLFCQWTGVTPKRFLQVHTLERAKALLSESRSILDVTNSLGLSSGSRLYDHFIHIEAVTPGEFKMKGAGLTIECAIHDTPFGQAFIATTPRGICNFSFPANLNLDELMFDIEKRWPKATLTRNQTSTHKVVKEMFSEFKESNGPLSLYLSGTNFQINVWKALLQIPPAKLVSYAQVARTIGYPNSARAVGQAVGKNPIAFLIPCHRVIAQSGTLGGYHWGTIRKQAMQSWETARYE